MNEKYREYIQEIIDALAEFQKRGFKSKDEILKLEFEGVPGQDIQDTAFLVIRQQPLPGSPQYKDFTRKDFDKISIEEEINALTEVIELHLYTKLPENLSGMLEAVHNRELAVQNLQRRGVKQIPVDQGFEANFRRFFNYAQVDQEIDRLLPEIEIAEVIPEERASGIKEAAKKDKAGFERAVAERIQKLDKDLPQQKREETARAITNYVATTSEGQALAPASLTKISAAAKTNTPVTVESIGRVLNLKAVEGAAEALATPIIATKRDETPISPAQVQAEIQIQIDKAKEKGVLVTKTAEEFTGEYEDAKASAKADEAVIINLEKSSIQTVPVKPGVVRTAENIVDPKLYGSETEIVRIATQEALAEKKVPVAPIRTIIAGPTTNPNTLAATNKNIEEVFGKEAAQFLAPEAKNAVAKIVAVPLVFGSEDGAQNLINQAQQSPHVVTERLVEEIEREVTEGPNQILSETEKGNIKKLVDDYVIYVSQLNEANKETPILDANKIKENLGQEIKLEAVLQFLPQNQIAQGEAPTNEAIQNALPVIPVIRDLDSSELVEVRTILNESFPEYAEILLPEIKTVTQQVISSEPLQTGGFWAGPIGKAYVQIGVDEIAKDDPLTAMAIKTAKQISVNAKALEDAGINHTLVELFKDRLTAMIGKDGKYPDVLAQYIAGQGLLETNQIEVLSRVQPGGVTFAAYSEAFIPQRSFPGNTVYGLSRRLLGNRAKKFVEGSIKTAAKRTGKVLVGRLASSAAGRAVIATVGFASGVVTAGLSIVGGWVLSKAKIGIKKRSGQVMALLGAGLGLLAGGPIGLVVGGLLGAGAAGLDWKRIGKWTKWITATLAAYFFARMVLPLIISIVVLVGGTIFVSFMLYIINSGAYVVPPSVGEIFGDTGGVKVQCFNLVGFKESDKQIESQAIDKMSSATNYMSQLCAGGDITVQYEPVQDYSNGKAYGGRVANGVIYIYPIGILSIPNAFYTLTHETGHIYEARYPQTYSSFVHNAPVFSEGFVCTYPFGYSPLEDFAESVAAYFSINPVSAYRNFACMNNLTFKEKYPLHWNFMNSDVFKDNLGW